MLITFWAGTYKSKEELEILIESIDTVLYELRKRAGCWEKNSCEYCKAKSACKDMFRFREHLDTVARDIDYI